MEPLFERLELRREQHAARHAAHRGHGQVRARRARAPRAAPRRAPGAPRAPRAPQRRRQALHHVHLQLTCATRTSLYSTHLETIAYTHMHAQMRKLTHSCTQPPFY